MAGLAMLMQVLLTQVKRLVDYALSLFEVSGRGREDPSRLARETISPEEMEKCKKQYEQVLKEIERERQMNNQLTLPVSIGTTMKFTVKVTSMKELLSAVDAALNEHGLRVPKYLLQVKTPGKKPIYMNKGGSLTSNGVNEQSVIEVHPVGRGGMRGTGTDPLSGRPASPAPIGFRLQETPSPSRNDRISENAPLRDTVATQDRISQNPKLTRRVAISVADRTTVASDSSGPDGARVPVRFTNVNELEQALEQANRRISELEQQHESRRISESGQTLQEKLDHAERRIAELLDFGQAEVGRDQPRMPRVSAASAFDLTPTRESAENQEAENAEAPVFLGQTPPPLEALPDARNKSLTVRIVVMVDWFEKLRAWIEGTTGDGSDIYYHIRDAAYAYYARWLENSSNPTLPTQLPLTRIQVPTESFYWSSFLTRSYSRVYKALPAVLVSEHLADVSRGSLVPFQKIAAVMSTALTNYSVQNLDEQTKLYKTLNHPLEWLQGKHSEEAGWQGLNGYSRLIEFAQQLPSVTRIDIGQLAVGVRRLVEYMMGKCSKLEADALSARVRETSLFHYTPKFDDLKSIVDTCTNLARYSVAFKEAFKQKKDNAPGNKDDGSGGPGKGPNAANAAQGDQRKEKGKEKGKGKDKGKGKGKEKGKWKGKDEKKSQSPNQGNAAQDAGQPHPAPELPAAHATQGTQEKAKDKGQGKGRGKCLICGKTRDEHENKQFCPGFCWICGKKKEEHANGEYCSPKND